MKITKNFNEGGFTQLNNLSYKLKSKRFYLAGFTLVEMLVVIVIITILSSLFTVNYKNIKEKLAVERAAYKLANDIRRTQEMAMSAAETGKIECNDPNQLPYNYGYGIAFRGSGVGPNNYVLFADCKDDGKFTEQDEDYIVGPVEITQSINTNPNNFKSIVFKPPDPTIYLRNDDDSETDSASMTVTVGSSSKTITINKAGLVDIQ